MKFSELENGALYVIKIDALRVVYRKVSYNRAAVIRDDYIFDVQGNHQFAELEPLNLLDRLTYETKEDHHQE